MVLVSLWKMDVFSVKKNNNFDFCYQFLLLENLFHLNIWVKNTKLSAFSKVFTEGKRKAQVIQLFF